MAADGVLVKSDEQDELLALMEAEGKTSKKFWHAARAFMKEHSDDLGIMKMGAHHHLEWHLDEFQSYFGGKLKTELVSGIFASVDGNHDGDVKLTSIMRWMEGKVTKEEAVEQIDESWLFKQLKSLDLASMDEDGDNKLQKEELRHHFKQTGISEDIIDAVFDAIDKNGDGNITAAEFFQWRIKANIEQVKKIVHKTMVSRVDFSLDELGIISPSADAAPALESTAEEVPSSVDPSDEPLAAPAEEEPAAAEEPAAEEPAAAAEEEEKPTASEPAEATTAEAEAESAPAPAEEAKPAEEDAKEEAADAKAEEVPAVTRKVSKSVRRATLVVQKAYFKQNLDRGVVEDYLKQKGLSAEEIGSAFERAESKQAKAAAESSSAAASSS